MNALIWLRTDLRTHDNPALVAAMEHGPTVALFCAAPTQWHAHDDAPGKVDFWLRNTADLADTLDTLNIPLKFLTVQHWHEVAEKLVAFCKTHAIDAVHVNAEWGINERERDIAVAERLTEEGIGWTVHHGATLLVPGTVLTGQGQCYKVFTPYARACRERLRVATPTLSKQPSAQHAAPENARGVVISRDAVPHEIKGYPSPEDSIRAFWPAGESAAANRLAAFCDEAIIDYEGARDLPAVEGTSKISAYLAAGVLSPNQCLHAALAANQGEIDSGKTGIRTWITELLWREFYVHLLAANPALSKHQPMQPHTAQVQWRDDDKDFAAWQAGRTGIPIVDAAMRQLVAVGWMHNRLRMVTAMFLSKNLLLDWRRGEAWFMQNLVDGDLASNNGGWQWSASTGADAAPYFRVFNPVTQSQRFDPDGTFLRKWLPELAHLDKKKIHQPDAATRRAAGYPEAIVDLSSSRRRAIDAFSGLSRAKQ